MRVLLTGAFGNIGICALEELVKQGHRVRCFDIRTKTNKKTAKKFLGKAEIVWGNICSSDDIKRAVCGQEIIIHLAAIIPPLSETRPSLTWDINVKGTENLLKAMKSLATPPKLIFASSSAVFGRTQHLPPPRKISDAPISSDLYTTCKILCEEKIKNSELEWVILRFGAVLSPKINLKNTKQFETFFEIPLNNRIEILHSRDAGLALANAVKNQNVWGKVLLVGGGAKCQLHQRYIIRQILENMGVGMFPDNAFGTIPYYTDWLDTTESQNLLNYQQRTFDDFIEELVRNFGWRRYLVKTLRPLVRKWILKQSSH